MSAEELADKVCRGEIANLNNYDLSIYTRDEAHQARRLLTANQAVRNDFGSTKWDSFSPEKRCELTEGLLFLLPESDASSIANKLFN